MTSGRFCARHYVSVLVIACMLVAVVPAVALAPPVTNVASTSHPDDAAWYSDDSPQFTWSDSLSLPELQGSYVASDNVRDIAIAGDTAYAAVEEYGLLILDVSEPGTPTALGLFDTSGVALAVSVAGDTAYVADMAGGLQIIDVSEPGTPTLHATYPTAGFALGVSVAGDIAYVSAHSAGLEMVDVSQPGTPTLAGIYDTPGQARDAVIAGDIAYVADSAPGLQVIDITLPSAPVLLGTCDTPDLARDVAVAGDTAYVADRNGGLQVIDVSASSAPTPLASVDTSETAWGVAVWGDLALVADGDAGLQAFDVSDPVSPRRAGTYDTLGTSFDVTIAGNLAYVSDYDQGMHVIAVSQTATPVLVGSHDTAGTAFDVFVAGDTAYVCDKEYGLHMFDVSQPGTPTLLGTYDTPGYAREVVVAGDIAYVADRQSGMQVIDVSDPAAPASVGSLPTVGRALGLTVVGNTAYIAEQTNGLLIVDVTDPSTPILLGTQATPGIPRHVEVSGDLAMVADKDSGVHAVDVSSPSAPVLLDTYSSVNALGVKIEGDIAYVADGTGGLKVLDVSEPGDLKLIGSHDTTETARTIAVAGNVAYLANRHSTRMQMFDISQPASPTSIGFVETPGSAYGVAVSGDIAYVADYADGLQVVDVGDGPVGYSYVFDQIPMTEPDGVIDGSESAMEYSGVADGVWWFHARAIGLRGEVGETSHVRVQIDTAAPTTVSNVMSEYPGSAEIALSASDAMSGVASTLYRIDDAVEWETGTVVSTDVPGDHSVTFYSRDNASNVEADQTVEFTVRSNTTTYIPLSGDDRYETAELISHEAFDEASADCVVVATGENWPDALGGAALAAAHNGPILLTKSARLSHEVLDEIRRLGVERAIILGGTAAVSAEVENALGYELGRDYVSRLGGPTRYETAEMIAAATIAELELQDGYDGTAFVATGGNFPDALAASSLAAAKGWPILLSRPQHDPPSEVLLGFGVTDVHILGGTVVVSEAQETSLEVAFPGHVNRLWGKDRYATAVAVAAHGTENAGMAWDGLAVSTGENFPDALSGGVLTGNNGSVVLLTKTDMLPSVVKGRLMVERDWISRVYYLGGMKAISQSVRDEIRGTLH